jgi:exonuclease III
MKFLSESLSLPSFLILNARSLVPKLDELAVIVTAYHPSIIVITESWLSENTDNSQRLLPNYAAPYRQDRIGKKGGGVCVYISSNIRKSSNALQRQTSLPFESLWIDIPDCKLFVCAVYIPPNLSKDIMESIAKQIMEDVDFLKNESPHHHVILTGDFNQINIQDVELEQNLKQSQNLLAEMPSSIKYLLMPR